MLNTARIAKNTIFLYMRMILVLAANFLAVRVLLEALFGASHADFINKYTIALKEASETHYWLDLLSETGYLPPGDATVSLLAECNALISILAACVKTAKQKGSA